MVSYYFCLCGEDKCLCKAGSLVFKGTVCNYGKRLLMFELNLIYAPEATIFATTGSD